MKYSSTLFRRDCNWSLLLICPSVALSTPSDPPLSHCLSLSSCRPRCLPPDSAVICRVLLSPEAGHSRPSSFPPGHKPPDSAGSEEQPQRPRHLLPPVLRWDRLPTQLQTSSPSIWNACCVLQVCSWRSPTLCTATIPYQHLSFLRISKLRDWQPPMLLGPRWNPVQAPTKQVERPPLHKKHPPSFLKPIPQLWNIALLLFLGSFLTVYISKLDLGTSATIYRFSLNTSTPSPWKLCSTEHDQVASFQVWEMKKSSWRYFFYWLSGLVSDLCHN